jgi:hypothetical protein
MHVAQLQQLEVLQMCVKESLTVTQAQQLAALPRFRRLILVSMLPDLACLTMGELMLRAIAPAPVWNLIELHAAIDRWQHAVELRELSRWETAVEQSGGNAPAALPMRPLMSSEQGWPAEQHPASALVADLPYQRLRLLRVSFGHCAAEAVPSIKFARITALMEPRFNYQIAATKETIALHSATEKRQEEEASSDANDGQRVSCRSAQPCYAWQESESH